MRLESFVWKRFEKSNRNVLNSISVFKYNCRKFALMKEKSKQTIIQSVKSQHNNFFKNKTTCIYNDYIKAKQKVYHSKQKQNIMFGLTNL